MKRTTKFLVVAVSTTALLACACGSDAAQPAASVSVDAPGTSRPQLDSVTNGVVVLPDGWFEMDGYGTVIHIDGGEATPHYVTASTCVVGEPFDNEFVVDHASDDGTITLDLVGPTTDYRLLELSSAPVCDSTADQTITALDELFTVHYPFFEQRNFDWPGAVAQLRTTAETDPDALPDALAALMVQLGDGHTTLPDVDIDPDIAGFGLPEVTTVAALEAAIGQELDRTIARVTDIVVDETGAVVWGLLDDQTGYLLMVAFQGISDDDALADREALRSAINAAMADLGHVDQLVVDMRFNTGGHEDLAVLAAGYFVDEPMAAYRKWPHAQPDPFVQTIEIAPQDAHFTGRVVVLTSPITASAAEVFTLAMVGVADTTVVGGSSFGEFSDAIDWTLPDGTELTLSMEHYTDLAGGNHEAVGVPVDLAVPFDQSVDAAIEFLTTNTSTGSR